MVTRKHEQKYQILAIDFEDERSMKGSNRALFLSTTAFAIAFALWGMVAPMVKSFQTQFHWTEQQAWFLIAIPVLLGSVGRIPMGMLADRWGGRLVFSLLLVAVAIPAVMLSFSRSYTAFVVWALLLGFAGTSFSVGIAFTSKWFPPQQQGFALGIYGAGNIGQSMALFGVPVFARLWGWEVTYRIFAAVALLWGVVFWFCARDAATRVAPKSLKAMLGVLAREPLSWVLSLFYFLTFGGFVALSISLPKVLQDVFNYDRERAGAMVAIFVVVATVMRPVGGWLSDRWGGVRVLTWVFAGVSILALGLTQSTPLTFVTAALGVGALIGAGNGAVFKLVPQYFPQDVGVVTGLVGAMGGLGGFFPPIVLGFVMKLTGSYSFGFVLMALTSLICFAFNYFVFVRRKARTVCGPQSQFSLAAENK